MYYSHPCSYCGKVFYTFNSNKEAAAQALYQGIKQHLIDYGEDHKEYMFDEDPNSEINQMYNAMTESPEEPSGQYSV